jgi:hypothetical protein
MPGGPPSFKSPRGLLGITFGGGPVGIFLDVPGISIIQRSRVFLGRLINKKIGKYLRNRTRIQLGIECVLGPLKTREKCHPRLVSQP